MLKYVVLHHTGHGEEHYDLMLDMDGVSLLRTYQLSRWPIEMGSDYTITHIGDHRRIYFEYEGPISDDRGQVVRVTAGTFHFIDSNHDAIRLDSGLIIHLPKT